MGMDRCGRTDEDPEAPQHSYYATVYCTTEDCSDPNPPTTTTTKEPTTTKPSSTSTSTSTAPTTTEEEQETTITQGDGEDCTFSAGCSATTDQRSDTHTPEEVSSSTLPTSPLVSTTEEFPSHINCAVECVGTEFSGRSWTVCSGQIEEKDCDKAHAVGKAVWECSANGQFITEQPDYSGCKSTWIDEAVEGSFHVNDTVRFGSISLIR